MPAARSAKRAPQTTVAVDAVQATLPSRRQRPQVLAQAAPAWARDDLKALFSHEDWQRDRLIEYLHRLQDHFGALSKPHLHALADAMKLAQAEVYEVASFYHHFELVAHEAATPWVPDTRPVVRVCSSLSCALAGGEALRQSLTQSLNGQARVQAAPCVGRCESAPVAVVHQRSVPQATLVAVQQALDSKPWTEPTPPAQSLADYRAQGGYAFYAACQRGEHAAEDLMSSLDLAGLRGLGGAGFPAGRKWRIVSQEPAPRLMAVNLDEGEPGTFKDRWYLEQAPHRFLEGLLIAAWAVGISKVYIYLRDEYHGCRALLTRELDALRADASLGPLPEIELRRGAGAYVCGEESAMIESIEGKRGWPRLRPPYVAQQGLFGRPTLEHNFETLYWVRSLVESGAASAAAFAAEGRHGRHGLRSFSVSGRVQSPGVKLAPAGITLRELIDEHCGGMLPGHALYAYLPGGASGGILPASLAHLPLDFDTLQAHGAFIGSAAVIVLSQHDKAVDAARNLMQFFEDESCGQCTPCRSGTAKMRALIQSDRWDAPLLQALSQVMRDASICGLGQAAPNPVDSVLRFFAHELKAD